MARFNSFTSPISVLVVVSLSLAIHISIVSSSSPSLSPAPSPLYLEAEYVSTTYHPSSFESPSPDEIEYDSLPPPIYPPLGLSHSSESPPPETDGYGEAPILPTTASDSPQQPPLTSPLLSPLDEALISPAPSTSPPSLSTEEDVESTPAPRPEDDDSEADLWPDHQITSSTPYKSSSSNSDDNDPVVYERKPEKQPEEEKKDSSEGKAGKSGVGFGVAMGVCMVGLGGLVYMKRRKGNDVRRTRSYMQLAERKSLI